MLSPCSPSDMDRLVCDFETYLRDERMRSAATVSRYVTALKRFARFMASEPGLEVIDLDRAEKLHLTEFLKREAGATEPPSRTVWNLRLAGLRAFYDFLFKRELVATSPADKIDRLRVNPKEPLPLNLDEFLALSGAAGEAPRRTRDRNAAIVQILFHSALRVAELVSLDLAQVDLDNRVFTNVRTKGGKWLSVPFNDAVAEALERYLQGRQSFAPREGETALLLSNWHRRLSKRAVQDMLTCYGRKAGIARGVTPHLLRHSSATELHELGTSLRVVQDICGHASVTTTERYVHVRANAKRFAIDALGVQVARRRRQLRRGGGADASAS